MKKEMTEDAFYCYTQQMPQKWLIRFDQGDEKGLIGFVSSTEKLPETIDIVRRTGGRNIVIEDQHPIFYDKPED